MDKKFIHLPNLDPRTTSDSEDLAGVNPDKLDLEAIKEARELKKNRKDRVSYERRIPTKTSQIVSDVSNNPSDEILYKHPETRYVKQKYMKKQKWELN